MWVGRYLHYWAGSNLSMSIISFTWTTFWFVLAIIFVCEIALFHPLQCGNIQFGFLLMWSQHLSKMWKIFPIFLCQKNSDKKFLIFLKNLFLILLSMYVYKVWLCNIRYELGSSLCIAVKHWAYRFKQLTIYVWKRLCFIGLVKPKSAMRFGIECVIKRAKEKLTIKTMPHRA